MVLNTRDRNIDSSRREDARKGTVDRCEVIEVHPHVDPFDGGAGDRDFNVVDVQLIDRPRDSSGAAPLVKRTRINCLQHYHGCTQGDPWTPRIGDMVLVYWIKEREGLVIGSIPSVQQEPICRSEATSEHQEIVHKRAPWEQPLPNQDGNYVLFPSPKHPDCFKWWPKTRDYITMHDCPYGHARPFCDKLAPCTCLDDLQSGTWWKVFSDISPTLLDKPQRVKFHHLCGSIEYWDADGTFHLQGAVAGALKGYINHAPKGTIEVKSASGAANGSRMIVVAPDDASHTDDYGEIAWDQVDVEKMCLVRGYKDGAVRLRSSADPTGLVGRCEVFLGVDGHCYLWNGVDNASIEFFAGGVTTITAPGEINLNAPVIKQNGVQIHPGASRWRE
jgi:hypothetical protein